MIDALAHPDAQAVARRIHPHTVTNNIIRATLDLKRGGDHEVEIPPSTTLKEYFGVYSISGKAYRTYGGSNKAFGEIARILMEYAFVHTNPTSMPQNKRRSSSMHMREIKSIGVSSRAKEYALHWPRFNRVRNFFL